MERLGTNEIQIGSQAGFEKKFDRWRSRVESFERLDQSQLGPANSSSKHQFENPTQYMKFSTILHLDSYHRDITVNKLIDARDARRKVERMSNKRKVVEYAEDKDETRNEPLSKIFKPSELNDLTSLKESDEVETATSGVAEGTEGVSGTPSAPKSSPTVGPQAEISDKVQNIPKLEPKKEPNELETAFKNIPEGYKYNGIVEIPKEEDMKTESEEPQTYEEISDALKPEVKSEENLNQENNGSEDEFFVVDEEAFEVVDELAEAKPEAETWAEHEDKNITKKVGYQTETEKKKAWENLRRSVSNRNLENQESKNFEKLLAEWKAEDKFGYTGPIEVQTKLIKSVSNDRCHQIERKTFVNDVAKILPFRARLKVGTSREHILSNRLIFYQRAI